ncbi:MAG TPA: family 43 glycosylhydrolase [Marmoricola sp.]|nr:family 43 glycosylhydrolase [Marmoricola sp.]
MHRSRIVLSLFALLALLAGGLLVLEPAQARPTRPSPFGQDPLVPGQAYTGDFPDPWIMRVGQRYFAYATTSGSSVNDGLNLPTLMSTDLRTWVVRPETPDAPKGDALPLPAAWAAYTGTQPDDGRRRPDVGPWAPAVAKIAKHHFVLAYAVKVAGRPGETKCISLAHSTSPIGPFVDSTTGPTVCPSRGAIDPQIFIAPNGRPWLVWKRDYYPARLFTQPMDRAATGVLPGKPKHYLAQVKQPWEGSIIENPAMIRFKNRYYLFYSANSYASTNYAIGYLICKSWKGDCYRPRKKPLLHTAGGIAGPGGPAPFIDTRGKLRLGYHAWSAGAVGYAQTGDPCSFTPGTCGQRRLYVARLKVRPDGRLQVKSYYR